MKDEIIYNLWNDFINDDKYKEYFISQYDYFIVNLNIIQNQDNKIPVIETNFYYNVRVTPVCIVDVMNLPKRCSASILMLMNPTLIIIMDPTKMAKVYY